MDFLSPPHCPKPTLEHPQPSQALVLRPEGRYKPLQLFQSGQLWQVDLTCQGGLILQKTYHAEIATPGAAVGGAFDANCQRVYTLGTVKLTLPRDRSERVRAFRCRMDNLRDLQHLTIQCQSPLQRSVMVLRHLHHTFGNEVLLQIPTELLAQLAAVLPETMARGLEWYQAYLQDLQGGA